MSWRLLAALEAAVLLSTALLLLVAGRRARARRCHRRVRSVLLSSTTSSIGRILQEKLQEHGCTVHTYTSGATSGAGGAKVDALVMIGAGAGGGGELDGDLDDGLGGGLGGITRLVDEDVNGNINLLESLNKCVRRGGCIAWVSAGAGAGAAAGSFAGAAHAFDAVLRASLQHVCKSSHCEPIWVGRHADAQAAADSVLRALLPCSTENAFEFTIRTLAESVSSYLDRCWKIVTLQASCPSPVT